MAFFGLGKHHQVQRHFAASAADTYEALIAAASNPEGQFTLKKHDDHAQTASITSKGTALTYGDRLSVKLADATGGTIITVDGTGPSEFSFTSATRIQKTCDALFTAVYRLLREQKKFIG